MSPTTLVVGFRWGELQWLGSTEQVLKQHGFDIAFVPCKATVTVFANELPPLQHQQSNDEHRKVLYPAASEDSLEKGLEERSENLVTRLNTYDTQPAKWTKDQEELVRWCTVACFGSPSAVNRWTKTLTKEKEIWKQALMNVAK
jgi:uroporphyrinogen-III synthase